MLIFQASLKEETVVVPQPNTRSNMEVAKLQAFNKKAEKTSGFLKYVDNKSEEYSSWRVDVVDVIVYIGRISRHLKEEYYERLRKRKLELYNCRRIFIRSKERIWWRR